MRLIRPLAALTAATLTAVAAVASALPSTASHDCSTLATVTSEARLRTALAQDPRFTVAVVPDTQYLFDGNRGDAAPLRASLDHLVRHRTGTNLRFVAGLGDITENGDETSMAAADRVYRRLDEARVPWSSLAGNHDVRGTDARGATPYLKHFGADRAQRRPGYVSSDPSGYSSAYRFSAAGRTWMVLSLDWRLSEAGFAWAQATLRANATTPTILVTHDLVNAGPDADTADGVVTPNGEALWQRLIYPNDQVILAIGGHNWPTDRTVRRNAAGHDVSLQLANYQDRYYGGSGMLRTYAFDVARGVIDVETFAPFWLGKPFPQRGPLGSKETELSGPADRFSMPFDLQSRLDALAHRPAPGPVSASAVVVPGTQAYWRFDSAPGASVKDLSGKGNDLGYRELPGTPAGAVTWVADRAPLAPGAGSMVFRGTKKPGTGGWFETSAAAPLNRATFTRGYTIEAFVQLPADVSAHSWMSVLSRSDSGRMAGKTGDDPDESAATLSVSGDAEMQWAVYPTNLDQTVTNWSHPLPTQVWHHVAVVNDGRRTVMYVDGQRVLRNPAVTAVGLATAGGTWRLGAGHYAGVVEQGFNGRIGDVRVVDHALAPAQFMTAR